MTAFTGRPLVSVIVPCYNQGRYLAEALNSVLAQTYAAWECIIVNDGSADMTREVARDFLSRDIRFRYVEQRNRGLSAARNRGLADISGRFVQFLDADDAIGPEKLALQVGALSGITGLGVVFCDHYYASAEDLTKDIQHNFPMPRFVMQQPLWDIASRWETELSIPVHSFLFDARIFNDFGIRFSERLVSHEDWDCWMRVFALPVTVQHITAKLAAYRVHEQSLHADQYVMWKGFVDAIAQQRRIWRQDPHVSRLLTETLLKVDLKYERSQNWLRALSLSLRRNSLFRRYFPWPGQKLVSRLLGEKT